MLKTTAILWTLTLLSSCSQQKTDSLPQKTTPAVAAETTHEINGVDLSRWQGEVDFTKIKAAGKSYVFIKTTQGNSEVDPNYKRNITNARAAGLAAGSYHFYVTGDNPESQYANFFAAASLVAGDLPPVVDIEALSNNSLPNVAAELTMFLSLLEKRYGVKPIIYSGEDFANEYLKGFSDYPLWLAEYTNQPAPKLPLDWKKWTFWQHTQNGTVAGVAGNVDLDRFNGDRNNFHNLLIK